MDNLGTIVLAVGALGTASFGIVEALKWTGIGRCGFGRIGKLLGTAVGQALQIAYGEEYEELLKAQYRANRVAGELPRTLRQGVRIGLTPETAPGLAKSVGVVDADALTEVAEKIQRGEHEEMSDKQRGVLGRYELALDARIDAALALANSGYLGWVRGLASFVSLALALGLAWAEGLPVITALVVGIAAVPVAPMAKDLVSALQAASTAIPGKKK